MTGCYLVSIVRPHTSRSTVVSLEESLPVPPGGAVHPELLCLTPGQVLAQPYILLSHRDVRQAQSIVALALQHQRNGISRKIIDKIEIFLLKYFTDSFQQDGETALVLGLFERIKDCQVFYILG